MAITIDDICNYTHSAPAHINNNLPDYFKNSLSISACVTTCTPKTWKISTAWARTHTRWYATASASAICRALKPPEQKQRKGAAYTKWTDAHQEWPFSCTHNIFWRKGHLWFRISWSARNEKQVCRLDKNCLNDCEAKENEDFKSFSKILRKVNDHRPNTLLNSILPRKWRCSNTMAKANRYVDISQK